MAAVTICSDFGAQENKVSHCFHCSPSIPPSWSDGANPALLYHLKIFYPSAYLRAKALCNVMIQISWLLLNTHPQSAFVPACILYVLIVHSFFFPPIDCVSFTPCSSVCFGECVCQSHDQYHIGSTLCNLDFMTFYLDTYGTHKITVIGKKTLKMLMVRLRSHDLSAYTGAQHIVNL